MPTGVQVTIGAVASPGGGDATLEAQFFLPGVSTRGVVNAPIIARSYAEFTDQVGPRYTGGSAHDAVRAYFAEAQGTGRVVFSRTVGPGATSAGTVALKDRSTAPGLNTLTINASSPGPWSSNLSVIVTDGITAGTFTIAVALAGVTVETYRNLTSPADAVTALSISNYVRAVNAGSITTAPGNNPLVGTFTLTAGADDAANVTATQLVAALGVFTPDLGPGIVAIPGQAATAVAAGIGAHINSTNRIGVLAAAAGTTVPSVVNLARTLRATTGARALGLVYPWVTLPTDGEATARLVSPEGAYAGRRAAVIGQVGVWQPPAGTFGQFNYIAGPEIALTAANIDSLVDDAIIPIAATPSPRIYGDRSLSADEVTWRFLSYSDEANLIAYRCQTVMTGKVGRTIDGLKGVFFAEVLTDLGAVLTEIAAQGGLVPDKGDPGWSIDLSANTPTLIAQGTAIADVYFRPPSVAELIRIRLTKTGFTPAAA